MEIERRHSREATVIVCGHPVTYLVYERDEVWTATVTIVMADDRNLEGQDVSLVLLDERYTAIEKTSTRCDFGSLPAIEMGFAATAYKDTDFFKSSRPPAHLLITLLGASERVPLLFPPVIAMIPTDPVDIAPPAMVPPPPDCCGVEEFNTPQGVQPNANHVAKNNNRYLQPRPWVVTARFDNGAGLDCDCCEYRQLVSGKMDRTLPGGAPENKSPILDYAADFTPKRMHPTEFREDATGDILNPGTPKKRYGYKPSEKPRAEAYTDCAYWCIDAPAFPISPVEPAGTIIDIDVTFRGCIVDVCCGGIKESKEWKWVQNFTV